MTLLIETSKGRQLEVPADGLRYHVDGIYKAEEDERTRLFAVRPGRRLTRFWREAGFSREELVNASGILLQTVVGVETSVYFPSYEATCKFADAVGRDSNDLLLSRRHRNPRSTS